MAEPRRERKVVTVVFCDLVGFTQRAERLDPEDVEALLGPYHERLRTELERYGGTVEKFIGDAVMALFGAPTAHEDDAERAVRACLAIRDWALEEEGVQVRIAVTTGEALIRLDARPEAGEGMASGDVVNTAARLQNAAPVNGILAGRDDLSRDAPGRRLRGGERRRSEGQGRADRRSGRRSARRARFGVDVAHEARTELVGRERELDVVREPSSAPGTSERRSSSRSSAFPGSARAVSCTSSRASSTRIRSSSPGARGAASPTGMESRCGRSERSSRRRPGPRAGHAGGHRRQGAPGCRGHARGHR